MLRLAGEEPSEPMCSRAGCTADAAWNVNWRNPKIHGAERVKVWLACDEHREYLAEYLATRDFPVQVTPLSHKLERLADADGSASPGAMA
jgi:hypothetical protein